MIHGTGLRSVGPLASLLRLPGQVTYRPFGLHSRVSVLVIIVLRQGTNLYKPLFSYSRITNRIPQELDKITGTFNYVLGAAAFDAGSLGKLISAGVILVGEQQ